MIGDFNLNQSNKNLRSSSIPLLTAPSTRMMYHHTPQLHISKLHRDAGHQCIRSRWAAAESPVKASLFTLQNDLHPLGSVHKNIKKEGDYWQTHPPICQRWSSSAVCICLTAVLCWRITKKPAQSTVSLTTPITLWGMFCSLDSPLR